MSLQIPSPTCHTPAGTMFDGFVDSDVPASPTGVSIDPEPAEADARRGVMDLTLTLRHGGSRTLALHYEFIGSLSAPVVLVAGGISADRHVAGSRAFPQAGWWDAQCGPGRALDPRHRCVLSFDWIGSDGSLDLPIDPADQAEAVAALLDHLGVHRLDAFVGCSYGAMVGLQFAALHPARLRRLVAISGCHRPHPYASAARALQRRAVALGALQCDGSHGLALARQLAMLGYRTPEEFQLRFGAATVVNGAVRVDAEDYLDHCGAIYADKVHPVAFTRLSESIDLQDVDPRQIDVPVTVVAVADDRIVPLTDACELVEGLPSGARLRILHSRFGHDAFLKEHAAVADVLVEALAGAPGAEEVA